MDETAEVVLFGSRARGDHQEDSDWDILILTSLPPTTQVEADYRTELYELELTYDQALSIFLFSREAWMAGASPAPLYDNIRREGVLL